MLAEIECFFSNITPHIAHPILHNDDRCIYIYEHAYYIHLPSAIDFVVADSPPVVHALPAVHGQLVAILALALVAALGVETPPLPAHARVLPALVDVLAFVLQAEFPTLIQFPNQKHAGR